MPSLNLFIFHNYVVVIEHWLNCTITKKVYIYASGPVRKSEGPVFKSAFKHAAVWRLCCLRPIWILRIPPFWPFEWALSTKTLPWYCLWHWQREKSLILPSTTTETCEKFPFADWFRYPDKRDNLKLFYQLFVKSITTVKSFPFVRNLKGQLERLMDNKRYSLFTIDFRLCSWQYL